MVQAEAHDLKVGQTFHFQPDGASCHVLDIGTIEVQGVLFYSTGGDLHSHGRDHTPVWVE